MRDKLLGIIHLLVVHGEIITGLNRSGYSFSFSSFLSLSLSLFPCCFPSRFEKILSSSLKEMFRFLRKKKKGTGRSELYIKYLRWRKFFNSSSSLPRVCNVMKNNGSLGITRHVGVEGGGGEGIYIFYAWSCAQLCTWIIETCHESTDFNFKNIQPLVRVRNFNVERLKCNACEVTGQKEGLKKGRYENKKKKDGGKLKKKKLRRKAGIALRITKFILSMQSLF